MDLMCDRVIEFITLSDDVPIRVGDGIVWVNFQIAKLHKRITHVTLH